MSHIVIDARRINSSTGHYTQKLLEHLGKIPTEHTYTVIVLEKEKDHYQPTSDNMRVVTTTADHYTFAEQLLLPILLYRLKPDIVHFTMPQQPILWFGKRVTTIHDTTLIRYENIDGNKYVYKLQKAIFTFLMRNVIWRSKSILSPTKYVSNDLDKWTGHLYTNKLLTVKIAGDAIEAEPVPVEEFKGKQFLFWVGNAFPYKNVDKIVKAFAIVKKQRPDLHLALAGKRDLFYDELEAYAEAHDIPDVHILGYISDEEKMWLMRHAQAYVVASLSEGFHMPLHEAMYENCPVISSNATCLPEVAGDAALYFEPNNVDQLADTILRLLDNPALAKELVKKGQQQVKKFSWTRTAEQTYDAYLRALRQKQ